MSSSKSFVLSMAHVKSAFFVFYFIFCFCSILNSAQVVPPAFSWLLGKIVFISILACFFLFLLLWDGRFSKFGAFFVCLLFFYLAFAILSASVSWAGTDYFFGWISVGFTYCFSVLIFVVSVDFFSVRKLLSPFLSAGLFLLCISVLMLSGYSIPLYEAGDRADILISEVDGFIFFSGPYVNKNGFGLFLVTLIPVLVLSIFEFRSKFFILLLLSSFFVSIFFVLLSVSRASILALSIMVFVVSFFYRDRMLVLAALILLSSLFFLVLSIVPDAFSLLSNKFLSGNDSGRYEIWMDALRTIYSNPLAGVGNYRYNKLSAHNGYLQIVASWGVPVFLFWVIIYGVPAFFSAIYIIKRPSSDRFLIAISSAAILAFLAHQMFEAIISSPTHQASIMLSLFSAVVIKKAFGDQWFLRFGKSITKFKGDSNDSNKSK